MSKEETRVPEIVLYHGIWCRSLRLRWILEEFEVPYRLKVLEYSSADLQSPEYLKIHPMGQLPALQYGDIPMFESGAIIEFLYAALPKEKTTRLPVPSNLRDKARYLQFFHFAESFMGPVSTTIRYRSASDNPAVEKDKQVLKQNGEEAIHRLGQRLAFLDGEFAQRAPYILGKEFSAADIMLGYGLGALESNDKQWWHDLTYQRYPHVYKYMESLKERPAYRKACYDEHNNFGKWD